MSIGNFPNYNSSLIKIFKIKDDTLKICSNGCLFYFSSQDVKNRAITKGGEDFGGKVPSKRV